MFNRSVINRVAAYSYGVHRLGDIFDKIVTVGDILPIDHEVSTVGYPTFEDQKNMSWAIYRADKLNPMETLNEIKLGNVVCPCVRAVSNKKKKDQKHGQSLNKNQEPYQKQGAKFRFGGTEIIVNVINSKGETARGSIAMK